MFFTAIIIRSAEYLITCGISFKKAVKNMVINKYKTEDEKERSEQLNKLLTEYINNREKNKTV